MYICDFSRSLGAGSAITRKMRGLTRSVIALIAPPFPAPSRPSKTMQIFAPLSTTQRCSLTNSTCRRASSFSYSFRFSLPSASCSLFWSLDIFFYFQVRKKPISPGIPPGYSRTSALSPNSSGRRCSRQNS